MDCDIDQLFTTNDPPSIEDLQKAHRLEADIQREISGTEAQIAALTARLSSLKAQACKYQSVTSPFRRIPTDLLHEIFSHCLPSHRNPLLSASEAPVLLTRVCSRWRKVALSSPRLWARVHITFGDKYGALQGNIISDDEDDGDDDRRRARALRILTLRCAVVREWLAVRSGTCPLSISIFYYGHSWGPTNNNYIGWEEEGNPSVELFRIITKLLYRCRHLELNMPFEVYQKLDQMITDSAPAIDLAALRALKFSCHSSQSPHAQDTIVQPSGVTLLRAPHLERLSMTRLSPPSPSLSDLLSTSASGRDLTHLCCHHYLTAIEILYILKHCRSLVHCRLFIGSAHFGADLLPGEMLSNEVVSLPRLLSLSIIEGTMNDLELESVKQLYSSIDAPKLRWINYENPLNYGAMDEAPDGSNPTPTAPILPLLQKSTQLTKLTLEPYNFLPTDFKNILEAVSPTLVHLVVGDEGTLRQPINKHAGRMPMPDPGPRPTSKDFLEWLLVDSSSNSEPLLPHLQIFESCPAKQSDEEILRFIISRVAASASSPDKVARLKLFRARFYRKKQSDVEQEVALLLRGKGLEGASALGAPPIKLDLQYLNSWTNTRFNPLSVSYAVDESVKYWSPSDTNEMYMPQEELVLAS